MPRAPRRILLILLLAVAPLAALAAAPAHGAAGAPEFPKPLAGYGEEPGASLGTILRDRIAAEPFNLLATVVFALAIIHTFLAPLFLRLSHQVAARHAQKIAALPEEEREGEVSVLAEILHFFGEVEAVFGIWVIPLMLAISLRKGWEVARDYVSYGVNFVEPMFVVVVMTMAASRPVLRLAERLMSVFAGLGRHSIAAWWLSILSVGPVLGSFITEPAAMTISALLLAQKFYAYGPKPKLAYATLGLLFVNVSVGGTLTHFAAPPVLMVATRWDWDMMHMLVNFGWKACVGIAVANALYFAAFRREFQRMAEAARGKTLDNASSGRPVPAWITIVHLLFLAWTVFNSHYPAMFIGGFLFYIAFTVATTQYQRELALRPALLVGFFLAGLVIHGGLQGWWIQPVLTSLGEIPLFTGATILTAFNDNAAITYLASLVPGFSPELKYAVVSGAVVGGGLTVIANAPNPAGQSILSRFFPDGVAPLKLMLGALAPTLIMAAAFLLLR